VEGHTRQGAAAVAQAAVLVELLAAFGGDVRAEAQAASSHLSHVLAEEDAQRLDAGEPPRQGDTNPGVDEPAWQGMEEAPGKADYDRIGGPYTVGA